MPLMHNDIRIQRECLNLIFKYGWTSKEVEDHKQISASTIRNWKSHYMLWGQLPAETHRNKARYGPRVLNRKFTPELKSILKEIVRVKPWLYLDEFQLELQARSGVLVSTAAIYKVLVNELRWSLQIAAESAKEKNEIDRAAHLATLNCITDNPRQFVFVDETSKDNKVAFRPRIWQPINGRASISRYFSDYTNYAYTMIGACDINGFVTEACELVRRKRNSNDGDDESGTVDAERFVQYVEHVLVPTLGRYHFNEDRSVVVMDNASIHTDMRVYDLITNAGAVLIYQSAYSPDYDPIEFAFHQYKSWLRRYGQNYGTNSHLAHMHALDSVQPNNMRSYYRMTGAIKNVPIEKVAENVDECILATCCAAVIQNNNAVINLMVL